MNKKQLAIMLSKLAVFENPDPEKEQYPTDSEVAADLLWNAFMQDNIQDKVVADLGSGTGVLGIGALLLGAKKVYFVDNDSETFNVLKKNIEFVEAQLAFSLEKRCEFIEKTVKELSREDFEETVEVVMQNPPFGVQKKHADSEFIDAATRLAPHVLSFHKTSTLEFVKKKLADNGFEVKMTFNYQFPLKKTMPHHKKRIERIEVSCVEAVKADSH